jgi:hypothetical protein
MKKWHWGIWAVCLAWARVVPGEAAETGQLLQQLRAVGPQGVGHGEATLAWERLAKADASELPAVLAGMDGAGPLTTNWIATAVDGIAERQLQRGGRLPAAELEKFLLDTRHAPHARRLAYEWLVRVDAKAPDRLLPGMLHDPSLELRRDAVARPIEQAAALAKAEKRVEAVALYKEALHAARDLDQVRLVADRLRKLGEKVDMARLLGYVVRWKVIGPFDNAGGKGFDAVYAPEREIRLDATYPGTKGDVRWVDFLAADDRGTVDLNKALGEQKSVAGYAMAEFMSDRRQEVQLRLSSDDAVKVWLSGKPVNQYPVYHSGTQPDQYVNTVVLAPGRNVILVKVCQNEIPQDWARQWDFQLRVCDADGAGILPREISNRKSQISNKSQ